MNLLLENILAQGPLSIEMNRHLSKKFEGYWNGQQRTIYLTKTSHEATLLTTLLFEMHNAAGDGELDRLDHLASSHKISRFKYIQSVEWWEYQNAKATAAILDMGIQKGVFPRECFWYLPDHFEDHLQTQQSSGHSAHIAKMYDHLKDPNRKKG